MCGKRVGVTLDGNHNRIGPADLSRLQPLAVSAPPRAVIDDVRLMQSRMGRFRVVISRAASGTDIPGIHMRRSAQSVFINMLSRIDMNCLKLTYRP